MADPQEPTGKTEDPAVVDPKVVDPTVTDPTADPKDPAAATEPTNISELKLEGDNIPEKFRGKTFGEFLGDFGTTEAKLTQAEQENSQWRQYYKETQQNVDPKTGKQVEPFDPVAVLGEESAQAVAHIINTQVRPVVQGVGALMREFTKGSRPDFAKYEKRVDEIYGQMSDFHKFHPQYGYDWAYRMAVAEKMEPPTVPGGAPPEPGPSHKTQPVPGAEPLTDEEKGWAKRMEMTEEAYRKFKEVKEVS